MQTLSATWSLSPHWLPVGASLNNRPVNTTQNGLDTKTCRPIPSGIGLRVELFSCRSVSDEAIVT
jgi:hypothetical protein